MRIIDIDASGWKTPLDFYRAIYAGIEAPEDASRSINALLEYMVWGDMDAIEPPYIVRISGLDKAPAAVVEDVEYTKNAVAEARAEFNRRNGHDVEVSIETVN